MRNLNYAGNREEYFVGERYKERALNGESSSRRIVLDESYSVKAKAISGSYTARKNYELRKEDRGNYADTGGGGNALGGVPTRTVFI